MYSDHDDPKGPGFPIRKSTDQSLLAAPHGLSQRATSFIASLCQGIHQMPLRRLNPTPGYQKTDVRYQVSDNQPIPDPNFHQSDTKSRALELDSISRPELPRKHRQRKKSKDPKAQAPKRTKRPRKLKINPIHNDKKPMTKKTDDKNK